MGASLAPWRSPTTGRPSPWPTRRRRRLSAQRGRNRKAAAGARGFVPLSGAPVHVEPAPTSPRWRRISGSASRVTDLARWQLIGHVGYYSVLCVRSLRRSQRQAAPCGRSVEPFRVPPERPLQGMPVSPSGVPHASGRRQPRRASADHHGCETDMVTTRHGGATDRARDSDDLAGLAESIAVRSLNGRTDGHGDISGRYGNRVRPVGQRPARRDHRRRVQRSGYVGGAGAGVGRRLHRREL